MKTYTEVDEAPESSWTGTYRFEGSEREMRFSASPALTIISWAYYGGCDEIEQLADGYGVGQGTHGDWSGVRDSSPEAHAAMLPVALSWVESNLGVCEIPVGMGYGVCDAIKEFTGSPVRVYRAGDCMNVDCAEDEATITVTPDGTWAAQS